MHILTAELLGKAKRQYLLTCKVSRYCILALHGSVEPTSAASPSCRHETLIQCCFNVGLSSASATSRVCCWRMVMHGNHSEWRNCVFSDIVVNNQGMLFNFFLELFVFAAAAFTLISIKPQILFTRFSTNWVQYYFPWLDYFFQKFWKHLEDGGHLYFLLHIRTKYSDRLKVYSCINLSEGYLEHGGNFGAPDCTLLLGSKI